MTRSHRPLRIMAPRSFPLLVAAGLCLGACAPSQRIYSLDPVSPSGEPLRLDEVLNLRLETGEVIVVDGALSVEAGRLVREDGSSWPVGSVHSVDYVDDRSQLRRARVETPEDLLDFDELPRITEVVLRSGRVISLGEDNPWSRWTEDRLSLELSTDGFAFELVSLGDLQSVTLYESSLVDGTVGSWKFWVVGAGAAALIYVISTRSEENQAVR